MANETITALGPLFGPNFILVQQADETGKLFQLQIYPDANNPLLRANGLATQYYFQPQRVYLAKKQDAPQDFDFGLTIFKGLMTTEDTIGITDANTTDGEVSEGGGICSFATTFAIPESVIQKVTAQLKNRDYTPPNGFQAFSRFFASGANEPNPQLGMVPILENNVTIEVPALQGVGDAKNPFFISASGAGKGSIEATSISAFLVTLNMLAAGAVGGSLKKGVSPFTVHYNLKQIFYINACDIHVDIDVDKVFTQFSAAASIGSGLFGSADLSANYQSCVTSGAIKTIIHMDGAVLAADDQLKKMIDTQVEQMQTNAFNLVKSEIFDWQPKPDAPAEANKGILGSVFGGAGVSVKANYQKRGIHLTQDFRIDTTTAIMDTVSGDLNDLEAAIKANLDKYFAIVDIGEFFKKLQVAATTSVSWGEKLSDGTDLSDPIKSIQLEVGYPDFDKPLSADNNANPQYRASGFHYTVGQKDASKANALAIWTADNPRDIINIDFMKLDKALPNWDVDLVQLRKTIVYNPDDPRVDLSTSGSTVVREGPSKDHAPIITPDEVGYVFVRFMLDRTLPKDNVTITLTCTLGRRTDTITITRATQKNILWEIFSDKYVNETSFKYTAQVEITGPNFTDNPVQYGTPQAVTVPLPAGRIKYVNPLKIVLPPPESAADTATANEYIKAFVNS
jgi:hypothetical protein